LYAENSLDKLPYDDGIESPLLGILHHPAHTSAFLGTNPAEFKPSALMSIGLKSVIEQRSFTLRLLLCGFILYDIPVLYKKSIQNADNFSRNPVPRSRSLHRRQWAEGLIEPHDSLLPRGWTFAPGSDSIRVFHFSLLVVPGDSDDGRS
jgi:hypothetical protein